MVDALQVQLMSCVIKVVAMSVAVVAMSVAVVAMSVACDWMLQCCWGVIVNHERCQRNRNVMKCTQVGFIDSQHWCEVISGWYHISCVIGWWS